MHTFMVIVVGMGVLGLCALGGHFLGGTPGVATALLVFLPVWLTGAAVNLLIGVKRAGYTIGEEAPIFLLVFAVPAVVALLLWWWLR